MVEIPVEIIKHIWLQISPPAIEAPDYCRNPHPKYVTEEHCPPEDLPEMPTPDLL